MYGFLMNHNFLITLKIHSFVAIFFLIKVHNFIETRIVTMLSYRSLIKLVLKDLLPGIERKYFFKETYIFKTLCVC